MESLERVVRRIKKDLNANLLPSDTLDFAALLLTYAFAAGTYKYPKQAGRTRSIEGFFAKGRSTEMSAEDAAALEINDQEFAKRTRELKAQRMRAKLAQTRKPAYEALLAAIEALRGLEISEKPWAEAGRIIARVNKRLDQSKLPPVTQDVIYRSLKKLPRS
jgi:hypothetical protein